MIFLRLFVPIVLIISGCLSQSDNPNEMNSSPNNRTSTANTENMPAAPKTTPTGITIGTEPPGVATGADGNSASSGNKALSGNYTSMPVTGPANSNESLTPTEDANKEVSTNPNKKYQAGAWPNIGFHDHQGSLGKKVVALTFDDGPDGYGTGQNYTGAVLDFLSSNKQKATFFVCSDVWTTLKTDILAQATLKRILAEGHGLGNHTFSHPHIDTIPKESVREQFTNNLQAVQSVLGQNFKFSMFRAPFGFPFETNNPNVPWVAPAAAPYGLHVGWGIDTDDWKCAQNGQNANCILTNLSAQLSKGRSGPILMHSVYALTVKTLPLIISMIKSYGYTIVTVDDLFQDLYGQTPAELYDNFRQQSFTDAEVSAAAVDECSKNTSITVVY